MKKIRLNVNMTYRFGFSTTFTVTSKKIKSTIGSYYNALFSDEMGQQWEDRVYVGSEMYHMCVQI